MSLCSNKMFYVSWEAFHRATKELAKLCLDGGFDSIVAVSRGGLVPAAILARELNIRVVDSICVSTKSSTINSLGLSLMAASFKIFSSRCWSWS